MSQRHRAQGPVVGLGAERCLAEVGQPEICGRLDARSVARLAACSPALRPCLMDGQSRIVAGSVHVDGAALEVALRRVALEKAQVVIIRVALDVDAHSLLAELETTTLPPRLLVAFETGVDADLMGDLLRRLACSARQHLSICRAARPCLCSSWKAFRQTLPVRFLQGDVHQGSWLHVHLPCCSSGQWPWTQNLPDDHMHPGLHSVGLNLSVRDLVAIHSEGLKLPSHVRQLYLRFSTWLPVCTTISEDILGFMFLPQHLDLLHVTFDWRDMLGLGAKALPSALPASLRHLHLEARGARLPDEGLVAFGSLPRHLLFLQLGLSGCQGLSGLLAALAVGMPQQLVHLDADFSWSDAKDTEARKLVQQLPPSLQHLSINLSHCDDMTHCSSILLKRLPEELLYLHIDLAYTLVSDSALSVFLSGLPRLLRHAWLNLSGNVVRDGFAGLASVLPTELESFDLVLHDAIVPSSLLRAAASRRHGSMWPLPFTVDARKTHVWHDIFGADLRKNIVVPTLGPLCEQTVSI